MDVVFLAWLCAVAGVPGAQPIATIWSPTKLATVWTNSTSVLAVNTGPSLHKAMVTCAVNTSCSTVCKGSSGDYLALNLISVAWNEPAEGSTMNCYTKRARQNLLTTQFGATVLSASPPRTNTGFKGRLPQLLIDGVYDLLPGSCFYPDVTPRPYVVFDLGRNVTVHRVLIRAQDENFSFLQLHFKNFQVRLGDYPTIRDFSAYTLIGRQVGSAPYLGYELVCDVSPPITARYLSVQRVDDQEIFQICHIELY